MLNYQTIKPFEKHLRDKSIIPGQAKPKGKSFIKSNKRPKSVIGKPQDISEIVELPLNKRKGSKFSMVSKKSIIKSKEDTFDINDFVKSLSNPQSHYGPINLTGLSKKSAKDLYIELY